MSILSEVYLENRLNLEVSYSASSWSAERSEQKDRRAGTSWVDESTPLTVQQIMVSGNPELGSSSLVKNEVESFKGGKAERSHPQGNRYSGAQVETRGVI